MYLYKKIRKARPYRPSYFIDKIECRNYIHMYYEISAIKSEKLQKLLVLTSE
jgi:hypothetical protein